jgi:hypothetical protein
VSDSNGRRALLPKPVTSFDACGKTYDVLHIRDVKGLGRFMRFFDLDGDESMKSTERAFAKLRVLVPELPDDAYDDLSANEISRVLQAASEMPSPPEASGESASASSGSSPTTVAGTQGTVSAT